MLLETQGFNLAGVGQLGDSDAQSVLLNVSDGWVNTARSTSVKVKQVEIETAPITAMNTDRLETVRTIISEVLRLPATEIDPEEPLGVMGSTRWS